VSLFCGFWGFWLRRRLVLRRAMKPHREGFVDHSQELKQAAISHLRKLAQLPQRVRAYFQHPQFRYAA